MSQLRHGRLTIELPPKWSDQSTLLFVGPAPLLPAMQTTEMPRPSIAITFVATAGTEPEVEARAILEHELEGMHQMEIGLEVQQMEAFETALGTGVLSRLSFVLDGVRIVQLQAVVVAGRVGVRAAASSGDFGPRAIEELRRCLESVTLDAAS